MCDDMWERLSATMIVRLRRRKPLPPKMAAMQISFLGRADGDRFLVARNDRGVCAVRTAGAGRHSLPPANHDGWTVSGVFLDVISAALSVISGGGLGIGFSDIPLFALGLFLGSLLWSPFLVSASSWISTMIQPQHLSLINRACGAVIVGCGLALAAASLVAPSM